MTCDVLPHTYCRDTIVERLSTYVGVAVVSSSTKMELSIYGRSPQILGEVV